MLSILENRLALDSLSRERYRMSFIVAGIATIFLLISTVIPYQGDDERYWHAWLGEHILRTHTIPHALGPESLLSQGSPWVAQQWLYGIVVALARDHHVFWLLAIADALGLASLLWFTLAESIKNKIDPGLTFLITGFVGFIAVWRFAIRAEDLALPLLILTFQTARFGSAHRCWLVLPLAFFLWANLHASFPLGLALCAYGAIERRKQANLWPIGIAALATLINPNGAALWGYAFWLPHSWVRRQTTEWQPLLNIAGPLIAALLLPLLLFTSKFRWQPRAAYPIGLWTVMMIGALSNTRFILIAVAVGVPAGCAAIQSHFSIRLSRSVPAMIMAITLVFVTSFAVFHYFFFIDHPKIDPAFGVFVPGHSAQIELADMPPDPVNVTLCAWEVDCTVLLYYGGTTVFDDRIDPFPEATFLANQTFFTDPNNFLRSEVTRIIANARLPKLQPPSNFRRVIQHGDLIIYERDFRLRAFEGPNAQ